jgi:aspartate racemase
LGIVGVAPWATLEFCKVLYTRVLATKDWHYPRVIVDINTKLPSRGRYFQLGETDPSPAIKESISELHLQGATVVVVPCNTAHILYDKWAESAPVTVPHIVKETLALAANAGSKVITPFVSSSLADSDLYGGFAEQLGFECRRLKSDEQSLIAAIINDVKIQGSVSNSNLESLMHLNKTLQAEGVDTVLFGCTELTIIGAELAKTTLKYFDSNVALAEAALKFLHLPSERIKTQ